MLAQSKKFFTDAVLFIHICELRLQLIIEGLLRYVGEDCAETTVCGTVLAPLGHCIIREV